MKERDTHYLWTTIALALATFGGFWFTYFGPRVAGTYPTVSAAVFKGGQSRLMRLNDSAPLKPQGDRIGPLAGIVFPRDVSGMSESADIRPDALRLVEQLPADASWDDLAYEVYVRQAITQGLADADAGRTVDHEAALARARARIRRAS